MASWSDTAPLVAIVGVTASGKSALALELAQKFNGEIIAADSRTVYKGMDIGTAKPPLKEQEVVPHYMLDVTTPDHVFTAADFKRSAEDAISKVISRGHLPLLVGGTGLYIDAVLYDFGFRPKPDPAQRQELSNMTVTELQSLAKSRGIELPNNAWNPRHLVRAIETDGQRPQSRELRPSTIIIGVEVDWEELRQRVSERVDAMIADGIASEVTRLGEQYGWGAPALRAPGYKAFGEYVRGAIDIAEAREAAIRETMQLAKRQRTWFRRNKSIHWVRSKEQAVDLLTTKLSK